MECIQKDFENCTMKIPHKSTRESKDFVPKYIIEIGNKEWKYDVLQK